MLWLAIIIGMALAFAIKKLVKIAAEKQQSRQQEPETRQIAPIIPTNHPNIYPRWTSVEAAFPHLRGNFGQHDIQNGVTNEGFHHLPPSRLRLQHGEDNTRALVWNWRRSIAGLIFLAQGNLTSARMRLAVNSYDAAVQYAFTSVENIARALIHCYGGKPDDSSGQEEALRLLSRRLEAEERSKFEKAIETVAYMQPDEMPSNDISSNPVSARILNELTTQQAIESASNIVSLFQQIMINHFREEIPELLATVQTQRYGVNWESPN